MNVEELKQIIEQRTGVPASLLAGETAEENIAQAKALLAYKKVAEAQHPKDCRDKFIDWLGDNLCTRDEPQDMADAELDNIAEAVRVEAGGFPMLKDDGQIDVNKMSSGGSAQEQFAEWFGKVSAFDPSNSDGWFRI